MGWSVQRETGLTWHDAAKSCKGYTMLAPIGGRDVLLLDMDGMVVKRWSFSDLAPFHGVLLENGWLLVLGTSTDVRPPEGELGQEPPGLPDRFRLLGGGATELREVDWDGNEHWRYANAGIHHDFVRLSNGNTLVPEWVELPSELAGRVRGGARRSREKLPPMLSDDIVEIDRSGAEVRRIHLWEFLDPGRDRICPLENRWEWTHTNSLDATDDAILFSCRQNSRVGLIDRSSGELRWKYGAPEVFHQHHASTLPNGHVLIYDNGMHRLADLSYSRIVEVNPATDEVVWEYQANPREQFFSGHISGAERQSNGNTLICEGTSGRVFEVTREGEVVWEWVSPFVNRRRDQRMSWIFRVRRYALDHPALVDREFDREGLAEFNRIQGLD